METGNFPRNDTLVRIAVALESYLLTKNALEWDETAEEYTNDSFVSVLAARRDGLAYGVSIPKSSATACTKLGANAALAAPVPGIVGRPAVDPYTQVGPFIWLMVNATVDEDGTTHVKAVYGDGRFRGDGTNGDVYILAPNLYWRMVDGDEAVQIWVSDTALSGYSAQPGAVTPAGSRRPYMLYAKYAGVEGEDGLMHSYSGHPVWIRSVSHNSLITQTACATTAYSGKSYVDDWYVKAMFLLKYATKNSQSVFAGCTNYTSGYAPAVAETGATRVVLTAAQAASLVVGSSMMLGTANATGASVDRQQSYAYDVFDGRTVKSIETLGSDELTALGLTGDYAAVNFDGAGFDTLTTMWLQTRPWNTGACDGVEGDGSPSDPTGGKEPFTIQGIELGVGVYEVLGDALLYGDGSTGEEICTLADTQDAATSVGDDYTHTGKYLPAGGTSFAWCYPLYPANAGGLLYACGTGASSTTGMCDGTYSSSAASGSYEVRSLGGLGSGAGAGLWCVVGGDGTGSARWSVGSRLSANGRKG